MKPAEAIENARRIGGRFRLSVECGVWNLKCAARDWNPVRCGHRALHGALRIRRRLARVGAGSARDVEDAVPYEAPSKTKRRAGTCAPPFHRLNAAAHGWPPYHGNDRIRRRSACFGAGSAQDVEDAVPYEAPLKTKRRAGTCAPPFHHLNAAAHGWPPYNGNDRIRRRSAR